ncbi:MAG: peptidase MA family metallohydrolase [Calditrichaceae bacterium]
MDLFAAQKQIYQYENYHFVYDADDSIYVKRLVTKIEKQIIKIEDFFNHTPKSIITIIITHSDEEYASYLGSASPEWSQALALTDKKIIILKIANADDILRSPEILLHELVHIFFEDKIHVQRIPVWLHEGIAQYLSGYELTINDRIHLANALTSNNIVSLTAMDTLFSFSQIKARLAYIEALTAIQFIIKNHGVESLKMLVENLSDNKSIDDTFKKSLGYDFIDFEIYWYEDIEKQNRWLIILNFDNILWISIVLLAIFAIIIIKIRNRKLEKSWEDDDYIIE